MIGLYQKHFSSPVGWLTLSANISGLCGVKIGRFGTERGSSKFLDQAVTQLTEYFQGQRRQFTVPLALDGTPFQKDVWQSLASIPYGVTPSYSDIASKIGRPSAVRAVGMAINKNPLLIVLPCHRVIGKNGDLTGYAAGVYIKRELLRHEFNFEQNSQAKKTSFTQGLNFFSQGAQGFTDISPDLVSI
jgi:methylated-DNA-[protein]-cysteine S-methyltransferase